MSISAEICRLLERAKPLRRLPADEAEDAGLGKLVEQINALRKQEADAEADAALASIRVNLTPREPTEYTPEQLEEIERHQAEVVEPSHRTRRKPGRPKKEAQ